MATRRSYDDACPIARALDVVGERWSLLVVRELIFGPQRFSDLRRALPGVSTNMLTDRLRELGDHGVVRQRRLPPPAASAVYELTDRGQALMPALEALGEWGAALPRPAGSSVSAVSMLLFLRGCLRARPDQVRDVYRVQLDDRVWTVDAAAGEPQIEPGEPRSPVAGLRSDPDTLNALLEDPSRLDDAITTATVETSGDLPALRRLLHVASSCGGTEEQTLR